MAMKTARATTLSIPVLRPLGAVAILTLSLLLPFQASAECEPFPDSKFWGKITHESVRAYVMARHDGEWAGYIKKWEGQRNAMKLILSKGGSAVIKSKNLTLEDESLRSYIKELDTRIDITRCLSLE